jgi:hypothetical protein
VKLSHTRSATAAVFDDPNLVSAAGLVLALAQRAGLADLADVHLSVPSDKGANAGMKVASLVAGMVAGADSIDDMALLRHGGMGRVFARAYAPSTLGSFLRSFTFGHVRQLDAVASRFLTALAAQAPQVLDDGTGGRVLVDVDDTIIEVHGHAKQGAGFGYSGVRGLNALLATVTTTNSAPVVVTVRTLHPGHGKPLLRADSAFYGAPTVGAAVRGGAQVSVTVRLDPKVKAAITTIGEDAWTPIEYTDALFDEVSGTWVSRAEVAEVPFTAFSSKRAADQVPGRLVVRRIPDLNPRGKDGQDALFDTWRFHAFFTTTDPADLDTVAADKTHRGHAIIEQVHADLKSSALAHLPSGKFTANAAWLVLAIMAFNLTRTAATIAGADLARATTATIRRKLIAVPARWRPRPGGSPCTCRPPGPGKPRGSACSPTAAVHHQRSLPDHPADTAQPDNRCGTP